MKEWMTDGYALVEDFLTPDELATVRREPQTRFPTWNEHAAAPDRYRNDVLGGHMRELPFLRLACRTTRTPQGPESSILLQAVKP